MHARITRSRSGAPGRIHGALAALAWWGTLLLLATAQARAQGPAVSVNAPTDVGLGDTVQVRIDLSRVANLGGLVFDVTYDATQVSLVGVDAAGSLAAQGLFATNPEVFPSASGKARMAFVNPGGLSQDGTLILLSFRIDPSAPSPIPVGLLQAAAVDTALAPQALGTADAAIEVLLAAVDLKTGFQLFTIPVDLSNPDPAAVFGDPAASVKVAAWDPSAREGQGDYVLYNGSNLALQPGRGYWSLLGTAKQIRVRTGRQVDPAAAFSLPLARGWNIMGNPFRQAVSWDVAGLKVRRGAEEKTLADAQQAGWVEDFAWGWQQDAVDPRAGKYVLVYDAAVIPGVAGLLEPGKGYWLSAREDCTLVVPPPTRAAPARQRSRRQDAWSVRFQAQSKRGKGETILGMAGKEGRGLALGLPPQPPGPRQPLRVASLHAGQLLAADLREGRSAQQEWELLVEPAKLEQGAEPEEVTVTWPDLRALPAGVTLRLIDPVAGARRYLRTTGSYVFRTEGPRHLRVVAEPRTGPAIAITGLQVVGGAGRSGARLVRFVLSAQAVVDIELLSPDGRRLASVARSRALEPGTNEIAWAEPVSPGVYLVRASATTDEGASMQATCPVVVVR